ncbi:MAG: adenosylcobalamin-dependent ribonucleoside-diphosphate reductase [Nanoarchaeota archaeon]|nr:adenosylcobalamin-dependent ribonucleoside-diphosphate reductase [Nanoarchaeota archaeon]
MEKAYSFDEAFHGALSYFKGDELAAKVWTEKYSLKDSHGHHYETSPDQMHRRIAGEIARVESKYPNPMSEEDVYSLLKDFRYIIPQGSPMAGIGNDRQVVSLSNCFVIGNGADSYGGIVQTDEEQVQLMKRRGGVGHDLSHLRPAKAPVNNSALNSTGVVSFMERYSNSTREVAQDGRRGALMLSISIKHPEAEGFIDAKMLEGKVTGANVSVRIDDDFMEAVREGKPYVQQFPVDSLNPTVRKEIDARALWGKIVHNAWQHAEPGILFWDTVLRESIPDCYADLGYETVSTNPCGEIPLCRDDSCRLLLQNLYSYVRDPFTDHAEFDGDLFRRHVYSAQRMMDNIVELELEKIDSILAKIEVDPDPEETKLVERSLWQRIRHKAQEGRRTGLGITGEGDMLAALNLTYGSDEAIAFSEGVHRTLALEAYRSSVEMARERGAFGVYDFERERDNPFIQRLAEADPKLVEDMKLYGRRNIALLTVAPAGSVSTQTQTTSGLEPAFQAAYERRRKINPTDSNVNIDFVDSTGDSWEKYKVFHHKFETWLEVNGYDVSEVKSFANESVRDDDAAKKLEEIVRKSPYHKATANDVDWVAKVRMQGTIQKWVDHSISVTVNLPEEVTEDLVDRVYQTAWESGCKGVTVYRDGSRDGVLLTGKEGKKKGGDLEGVVDLTRVERPEAVGGRTVRVQTPYNFSNKPLNAFITLNRILEDENPALAGRDYELFISMGRAGGDLHANMEGYGRLISLLFKKGATAQEVYEQLSGITGETQQGIGPNAVRSLPDTIAKGIDKILMSEGNGVQKKSGLSGNLCPECSAPLIMEEGCQKCLCGYSKC